MKKKISLLMMLCGALTACVDSPIDEITLDKHTVTFCAAPSETRTHLVGNTTYWDDDDQIGGFAQNNTNVLFSTIEGRNGYFTGEITGNPEMFYLYYPYQESATFASATLSATMPAVQQLAAGTTNDVLPMVATATDFDELIKFTNLCGIVKFNVKSNRDRTLKSLTFTAADEKAAVSGPYKVNMSDPAAPVMTMKSSGTSNTVTLEGEVEMEADKVYDFYVALPPATYAGGFNVTLTDVAGEEFSTADDPETYNFAKDLVMKASMLISVSTVIEFNSEIEEEEATNSNAQWIWATSDAIVNSVSTSTVYDATDLSLDGQALANCYIVSKAGTYSFPALKPDGTAVDTTNPDVVINFTTSGIEGNAVIAYLNEAGKILWSWHIWCTDKPADQKWNANTWLDRNLGAVTAVSGDVGSYGLMYQWGRKDPFPGSKLYSWSGTNDETTAFSADYTYNTVINGNYAWKYSSGTGLTIDEAIAQPMHMCQNATNDSIPDPNCAGCGKVFNKVTRPWVAGMCAVAYSKLWLDDQKTIYDPCPAGYRVPTQAQVKADFSDLTDQFATSGKTNGLTLSSVNCWLPAAGYRTYGGNGKLFKVGTMGHYWTSTTYFPRSSDHHYGATFYTMAIRETTSGVYGITSNGQLKASENAAVRCVKE
ncbi:MAG: hypothetical protein J6J10_05780 [Alistipes sp.]|nr:hypothetical protein [Alistipes sp.]